jgi:hypothetical protein
MEDGPIRVGRIFVNVAQPRRAWRVTAQLGDNVRLERVDQPNVVRFPLRKVLLDLQRYVPDE